jgi:hypothetical protein
MLFIGKASRNTERSYALFDIGAASIGVCLGVSTPAGPRCLWSSRLAYAFGHLEEDYTRYERTMYATLLEAGMSLMGEGILAVRTDPSFDIRHLNVMCVLAPPWFLASVQHAQHTREKPFEVTHGLLDSLRSGMFSTFMGSADSKSWRDVMGTPLLLEQRDIEVRFNGYRIASYKGRHTPDVAMRSYLAVVSQPVLEHVEEIVHRVLPNHELQITTSTRLLAQGYHTVAPAGVGRVLVIELGGRVTGLNLISETVLVGTRTLPLGTHHLLDSVAAHAASASEARSALDLALKEAGGVRDDMVLPETVRGPLAAWRTAVEEGVRTLTDGVTPPRTALLLADGTTYPLYANTLKDGLKQPGAKVRHELTVVPYAPPTNTDSRPSNGTPSAAGSAVGDVRLQALLTAVDDSSVHPL